MWKLLGMLYDVISWNVRGDRDSRERRAIKYLSQGGGAFTKSFKIFGRLQD